ncbi:MAG: hypothetical protein WCE61_04500 [Candidatus Acidiferrum sp.]
MTKRRLAGIFAATVVIGASLLYGYQRWGASRSSARNDSLALMPADASAVLFIDFDALRKSPFLADLYMWAPQTKADADYRQFLQSTGFDYERDLHLVSIAIFNRGPETTLFAVADGRFDQKKISAYALQSGTRENRNGREIFSVPVDGGARRMTFAFLRNDRIALTNGANLESFLSPPQVDSDTQAWRERFRRLAGSPLFAVVRRGAALGAALSIQAPGGLRSPELSSLIGQLEWITFAGKPETDAMRIVIEGEGPPDAPTRQLSDVLNGLLVLAQAGLNDPKMRQQLQPGVREAYVEMLKSADVSQIDRGETKSVRLVFDLTTAFLEAARSAIPAAPAVPPNKVLPKKSSPKRNSIRN